MAAHSPPTVFPVRPTEREKLMLTETIAKTTPPPATGTIEVRDEIVRGLSCRITANGSRAWSLRYAHKGRTLRQSLGRVGEVPLRVARSEALRILAAAAVGQDPRKARTRTLASLFDEYAAERALVLRRPEIDRALWANHVAGPLRAVVTEAGDITKAHIAKLDAGLIKKGLQENARRSVHRILSGFFRWCVEREIIEASPVAVRPPAPRVQRETVPDVPTMRAVWTWASGAASGAAGAPIALICLTGLRQREASGLRWAEVFDLDGPDARLVIGADRMKAGRDHLVPLSPQAVALLKAQEPVRGWSKFVFPARRISGAVFKDRPTGANLPEQLRLSGVSKGAVVHDLRKGVAGGMASLGIPPHLIGMTLSHSPGRVFGQTTSIYLKADYAAERRAALEAWAGLLTGEG
jgi:integrase